MNALDFVRAYFYGNNIRSWKDMRDSNIYDKLSETVKTFNINMSFEEYIDIVNKQIEFEKLNSVSTFGEGMNNTAQLPKSQRSSWVMYRDRLSKQWSSRSINNLEQSAYEVLRYLTTTSEGGPHKGLVVGNVQSGKTANMTALIAMAADNGFNVFIVLSGMIENLRKQNAKRIYNDLVADGSGDNHWKYYENLSVRTGFQAGSIQLGSGSWEKHLIFSLKNSKRIRSLLNWLRHDRNKQKKMKVLLIDDEADQASINTKDVNGNERTVINSLITNIVNDNGYGAMNYVSYTATPFANVLNESGEDTLYPKNFITLLKPGENYIGPKQIFGLGDPKFERGMENIVNEISEEESGYIRQCQKDEVCFNAPKSMRKAVDWFLIALSAMRSQGYKKPVSMMIHTDFKVQSHALVEQVVQNYLASLRESYKENSETFLNKMHEEYDERRSELSKETFNSVMKDYYGEVQEYPKWKCVKKELDKLFRLPRRDFAHHIEMSDEGEFNYTDGIHLCVDNSAAKDGDSNQVRLVYPSKERDKATAFIVIGGNTLSRGLTIEGLVSTYFLRRTSQADTLMQMGRWFGYRQNYELMPRIWMDKDALDNYEFLTEMNEDMRRKLMEYAEQGFTPREVPLRIKQIPSYINVKITADNKMQSAQATDFNFEGMNYQSTLFANNERVMKENLKHTKKLLESLGNFQEIRSHMVWKNVPNEKVEDYLEKYQGVNLDKKISSIPHILEWLEENGNKMEKWNVVLVGKGKIRDAGSDEWNINGKTVDAVRRSAVDDERDELINIRALLSPQDLTSDIEDISDMPEEAKKSNVDAIASYRRYKNVDKFPQLLIYRIDKDSKAIGDTKRRKDLNSPYDLIGVNILLPESSKRNDSRDGVEYVAVKLEDYGDDRNFDSENEEDYQ